ncbi:MULTISPECIES: ABC transporter ATP-binding protein [Streptomyces]|uniref:ABC transporter ATP-binding protein n=1 Tax=Streptomyces rhizosphaericus TaxID=114699 RepID=A0A6G4ARD1_9ACTN|nr:ABC transporter ATP-binding protein [Streptomyces rhizosphaericus]MBI0375228.1 ABC transporter ATP-binding protein [Streptomyces albiflaviniger]NEW75141.1 ABC transporter ATP-binding protein [Streptomyces rhizosphaericus]
MNTTRPIDFAVVVDGLVKKYPGRPVPAVDNLSFTVRHGEVFGFLGPNGAGKTTTIGILTTRVAPSGGRAFVQGVDVVRRPAVARQSFAIVPQRNNLDRSLTIRQNLTFHAGYHGLARSERNRLADESLEWVGLGDHAKARADQVSGGQAQRVMIARALMHRPRVLFLDEPATGLDPQSQIFVRDRVAELKTRGVTVVITTHDMEEASKLCDRIGIVDHGKLLALDTPEALTSRMSNTALTVTVRPPHSGMNGVVHMVQGLGVAERVEVLQAEDDMAAAMQGGAAAFNDGTFRMKVYSNAPSSVLLPTVIKALTDTECEIKDLNVSKASLEDVFVDLTGKEMR